MLGQFGGFLPDVPLFTGRDRHLDRSTHPVQVPDQRLGRDLLAEQRLVAHHDPDHAAGGIGQFDRLGDFAFVAFQVRADPDPQGDA